MTNLNVNLLWIIAFIPALIASIYLYGLHALRIITLCIAFSVIIDAVSNRLVSSKDRTGSWHSVVMALLLACLLPFSAPCWLILVGCFLMIVIGKKLFGGQGAYPVHPVLLSVAMMMVSWPQHFDYTASLVSVDLGVKMVEPFRLFRTIGSSAEEMFSLRDLFFGYQVAGIANAMVIYLLIGGFFLILLRQITWHIPVAFLLGTYTMALIFHTMEPAQYASPLFFVLTGGTVFAAFFLATESTTSPVNPIPMFIYGFLGGLLLVLIRTFSSYNDGVVFVILLINLCNPLIDRWTPKPYGIKEISNA